MNTFPQSPARHVVTDAGREHHLVLRAASQSPAGTVFACGDEGWIGRWNADRCTWTTLRFGGPPLLAIHARSDKDIWAFGIAGVAYRGSAAGFEPLDFPPELIRELTIPEISFTGCWFSPVGLDRVDVFGIVVGTHGTIMVYDGTRWSVEYLTDPDGQPRPWYGIHFTGVAGLPRPNLLGGCAEVVIVGTEGRIFRRNPTIDGPLWAPLNSSTRTDLYAVLMTRVGLVAGGVGGTMLTGNDALLHEPTYTAQNVYSLGATPNGSTVVAGMARGNVLWRTTDSALMLRPETLPLLDRPGWLPAIVKSAEGDDAVEDIIWVAPHNPIGKLGHALGHAGTVYVIESGEV